MKKYENNSWLPLSPSLPRGVEPGWVGIMSGVCDGLTRHRFYMLNCQTLPEALANLFLISFTGCKLPWHQAGITIPPGHLEEVEAQLVPPPLHLSEPNACVSKCSGAAKGWTSLPCAVPCAEWYCCRLAQLLSPLLERTQSKTEAAWSLNAECPAF